MYCFFNLAWFSRKKNVFHTILLSLFFVEGNDRWISDVSKLDFCWWYQTRAHKTCADRKTKNTRSVKYLNKNHICTRIKYKKIRYCWRSSLNDTYYNCFYCIADLNIYLNPFYVYVYLMYVFKFDTNKLYIWELYLI